MRTEWIVLFLSSIGTIHNYHYQSGGFVCTQWAYADNLADAVDWRLIF